MAAKPTNPPMAIVDETYYLPLDEAIILIGLLAKAKRVERDWRSNSTFRYKMDNDRNGDGTKILALSQADEACLAMNSEPAAS